MRLIGFHTKQDIRRLTGLNHGDIVTIPAGTRVKSFNPSKREYILKKAQKVKIDHFLPGQNVPVLDRHYSRAIEEYSESPGARCVFNEYAGEARYNQHGASVPISNPSICWAGAGGYWCEVDINDVIIEG